MDIRSVRESKEDQAVMVDEAAKAVTYMKIACYIYIYIYIYIIQVRVSKEDQAVMVDEAAKAGGEDDRVDLAVYLCLMETATWF